MSGPERRQPGSFRDPCGFLFRRAGVLYRQVNQAYRPHYERVMASGLYAELTQAGLLIAHEEVDEPPGDATDAWRTLRPVPAPFISYPYEWCFSQFQDAALATLEIQRRALQKGLWLKDASAYNIQFVDGRPLLIDTLSFECLPPGRPWVAYRQFCQHFLAPLALMAECDVRLGKLARLFMDGIPLDLASRLLPARTRWRPGLLMHIHLHARAIGSLATRHAAAQRREMSGFGLQALRDSLESIVRRLRYAPRDTEWGDYYTFTNYSADAFADKQAVIARWIAHVAPRHAWDLGANDGTFSRLAAERGAATVAFDVDPAAVEKCYRAGRERRETRLLPLVMDLTNPSPGLGWDHTERQCWRERGRPDLVMALALVHHLAIGNNIPLPELARFFAAFAPHLIIEFVPKSDSQVQRMLATRDDVFPTYTPEGFAAAFGAHYREVERRTVVNSDRTLHLLQRQTPATAA